jgi:putative sigma-54 modulation protein
MKIDIQTLDFEAPDGLLADLNEVLQKFTQFEDRITGIDVYLKKLESHNVGTRKAEFKLYVPGANLYADHQANSFHEAIHEAAEKMKNQLLKRKELIQQKRP